MSNENSEYQEPTNRNDHGKAIFTGVLLGGLTGAITALLLAPQSGAQTRNQIQSKASDLRTRAGEKVESTLGQVRERAGQLKADMQEKAQGIKQEGQDVLARQLDRVSAAAEAGKRNIQGGRS